MLNSKPCNRIKGQQCSSIDLSIRSTLIESIVPRTAPVVLVDAQFEIELSASSGSAHDDWGLSSTFKMI